MTKRKAPSGEKQQAATEKALLEFARRASLTRALPANQNLMTSKEVAAALKVSQRTLSYWTDAKDGRRPRLAFVKLGRAKRFVVADILRFIEEQKYRSA